MKLTPRVAMFGSGDVGQAFNPYSCFGLDVGLTPWPQPRKVLGSENNSLESQSAPAGSGGQKKGPGLALTHCRNARRKVAVIGDSATSVGETT